MNKIELIKFTDELDNYKLMYKWCSKEFVYEWFEQRILSLDEIIGKYKTKLMNQKQKLFFINYNNKNIGFVQIYEYIDKKYDGLNTDNNIYEYDIFIGEDEYLSRGIGSLIINYINEFIYKEYLCDCIILRPFKRNIRAIKCYQKNGFKIIGEENSFDTVGNNEKIVIMINEKQTD